MCVIAIELCLVEFLSRCGIVELSFLIYSYMQLVYISSYILKNTYVKPKLQFF